MTILMKMSTTHFNRLRYTLVFTFCLTPLTDLGKISLLRPFGQLVLGLFFGWRPWSRARGGVIVEGEQWASSCQNRNGKQNLGWGPDLFWKNKLASCWPMIILKIHSELWQEVKELVSLGTGLPHFYVDFCMQILLPKSPKSKYPYSKKSSKLFRENVLKSS